MQVKLIQTNVGSQFRFLPVSASSTSIYDKPKDGWLTEAAARKWAKEKGHTIVSVEKVASKGEKIFKLTYTFVNRLGRETTRTTELVGKSEVPLKERILEGLKRNGDTFKSWGKIVTKDSIESIREKYSADVSLTELSESKFKKYGTKSALQKAEKRADAPDVHSPISSAAYNPIREIVSLQKKIPALASDLKKAGMPFAAKKLVDLSASLNKTIEDIKKERDLRFKQVK